MDTNTMQTNTFNKGMNTDASDMIIGSDEYRLANNLRYTTTDQENSGELHIIEGAASALELKGEYTILATTSIRNYGIVIYEKEHDGVTSWYVDRFENPYDDDLTEFKPINQTTIFGPCNELLGYEKDKDGRNKKRNKISLVTKWESDDIVKLYIADGVHPILYVNIKNDYTNQDHTPNKISEISSQTSILLEKPLFAGLVQGQLKTGLVQYSYRLYENHGASTFISPTTKLIQIGDHNVDQNTYGNNQDYVTNTGVQIKIPNINHAGYTKIQIFRIQYQVNGQNPTIDILYDGNYEDNFYFRDEGKVSYGQLTLEEYNASSGIHIIPKVIESKNDYLFAANIKNNNETNNLFSDWDARSFSFTPVRFLGSIGYSHLYNYPNLSDPVVISTNDLKSGDLSQLDDNDCYNMYNDMSYKGFEYEGYDFTDYAILGLDEEVNKGYFDRYDKDGYYGGSGLNVDWRFVVAEIHGDESYAPRTYVSPNQGPNTSIHMTGSCSNTISHNRNFIAQRVALANIRYDGDIEWTGYADVSDYVTDLGVGKDYINPAISYCFKSLRRDELYRFGIILYDKNGNASDVKWIADIRTPSMTWRGCEAFVSHGVMRAAGVTDEDIQGYGSVDLSVRPLGINFTVRNLPEDCAGYEIVRCNRTIDDIATITQGVVARPIKENYTPNYTYKRDLPYVPSGFLTTNRIWEGEYFGARNAEDSHQDDNDWNGHEADNFANDSLYQFVSPEIVYQKDQTLDILKNHNITLNPIKYVFGGCGCEDYYEFSDKKWYSFKGLITPQEHITHAMHTGVSNTNISIGDRVLINGNKSSRNDRLFARIESAEMQHFYSTRMNSNARNTIDVTIDEQKVLSYLPLADYHGYDTDKEVQRGENSKAISTKNAWDVISNVVCYTKLYEQTNTVISRLRHEGAADRTDGTSTSIPHLFNLPTNVSARYQINGIAMAPELGWDDFAEEKSGEAYIKYRNFVTNIGSNRFCNWVCGGTQDIDGVGSFELQDDYNLINNNSGANQLNGPGGRCLLLDITSTTPLSVQYNGLRITKHMFEKAQSSFNRVTTDVLSDVVGATKAIVMPSEAQIQTEDRDDTIFHKDKIRTLRYVNAEIRAPRTIDNEDLEKMEETYFEGNTWQASYNPYYEGSLLGTFICNIRRSVVPYTGGSKESRKLSSYYSYGDFFKVQESGDNSHNIFNGDCYIAPMEYVSMHKCYSARLRHTITLSIVYAIPLETNINLCMTHGYELSKNYEEPGITNLQIEASNVDNKLLQDKPLYQYNTAYSQQPTAKVFVPDILDTSDKNDDDTDYRVFYSNPKSNKETFDNWLKFQPLNYLDVDTRYGQITGLRTFHNDLVFWQEEAAGVLSVNERTTITDDSNMPLILGTGGVLSRYDYFNSLNGMRENEFADAQSDTTLYWWDHNKHEICAYAGGKDVVVLSKLKNVQNFLNKMTKNGLLLSTPILAFDKQHNELICNVSDGDETSHESGALVYSERTSQFTSLYDIHHTNAVQFSNVLYLFKAYDKRGVLPGRLIGYEWNRGHEDIPKKLRYKKVGMEYVVMQRNLMPYLKYVVNQNSSNVKVFDNVSFGASYGTDSLLKFTFNTPLGQNSSTIDITNREYDYRLAVPRNNGEEYGGRMRGKTMQCEVYKYDDALNNNFALQYINTKYRISWS